jgi:F420H(2)-dependent quinone reductase
MRPELPAVEDRRPPPAVLAVVNPVLRTLLRSPLHKLLGRRLILVSVDGRKTGRAYTVPVGRHQMEGVFVVSASGTWRHNLRGGASVRVVVDGRERSGYAELEERPDVVARVYKELLERSGPGMLGLRVNVARPPTVDEIAPAVARRAVAHVRLTDRAPVASEAEGRASPLEPL